jgi:hypothetical protein
MTDTTAADQAIRGVNPGRSIILNDRLDRAPTT